MGPAKLVTFVLLLQPSLVSANPLRITGGQECNEDSHPWLVLLYAEASFMCGATLLNQDWVLTAAHCYDSRPIHLYFGIHNTKQPRGHEQARDAVSTFCYPDSPGTTNSSCPSFRLDRGDDIMLIKLNASVTYNEHIAPMALPDRAAPLGTECDIIGWGETELTIGSVSHIPFCASINTMDNHFCQDVSSVTITDDMICAGVLEGGPDACKGDSGGPLLCGGQLQGLVSFGGYPCGQPMMPGVYTKIFSYREWIYSHIR
uniref:Kallikrein-Var5 n=1 Tax=Varanus mitchelli TaxID=62045 RepID=Q2XXN0_9SAUR|nr:kallikrein-Var5 [Varanus mitchelli]